jgi:FKBP-type peptidyl-prolyl cis-trans isomerase
MWRTGAVSVLVIIVSAVAVTHAQDAPSTEKPNDTQQAEAPRATTADSERTVTTPSGLVYEIVEQGSGPAAKPGQHVVIHETTALADGTVIYSTRTTDRPLKFLLGGKQVIDGVDEAVTGMKVGERRKLIVPPKLSKRSTYPEGISPEATLYYDIQLVAIEQE